MHHINHVASGVGSAHCIKGVLMHSGCTATQPHAYQRTLCIMLCRQSTAADVPDAAEVLQPAKVRKQTRRQQQVLQRKAGPVTVQVLHSGLSDQPSGVITSTHACICLMLACFRLAQTIVGLQAQ